jgi:hypothetical protein
MSLNHIDERKNQRKKEQNWCVQSRLRVHDSSSLHLKPSAFSSSRCLSSSSISVCSSCRLEIFSTWSFWGFAISPLLIFSSRISSSRSRRRNRFSRFDNSSTSSRIFSEPCSASVTSSMSQLARAGVGLGAGSTVVAVLALDACGCCFCGVFVLFGAVVAVSGCHPGGKVELPCAARLPFGVYSGTSSKITKRRCQNPKFGTKK